MEDWSRNVLFFFCFVVVIMSVVVEGCMVAWLHRAQARGCPPDQVRRRRPSCLGRFGPASPQGVVVASCRTKAGAGLPWPMGDAARPERRDGGPGLHGTRGKEAEQSEKKLDVGRVHGP